MGTEAGKGTWKQERAKEGEGEGGVLPQTLIEGAGWCFWVYALV